jgi:hypothetical protein
MHRVTCLFSLTLALMPLTAGAHGPSRLKLSDETRINAPPEKVWGLIKGFCSIEKWHPAIAKCEGQGGNGAGATRLLTLKREGDPQILEELLSYDEGGMTYKYKIKKVDVKVLPVTTYSAFLTVTPGENGGSVVSWKGGFYRGYPNNNPPADLNDQAAITAVTEIYKTGLASLKKLAEAK